jgi:hypothetical protein
MRLSFALALLCALVAAIGATNARAGSNGRDTQAVSNAAPIEGTACKRNLEQFVLEMDAVLAENYMSIFRYTNVLATRLNSAWGRQLGKPDASVMGCKIDEVIEVAKRSKFFFEADGPPRYANHRIEFRNRIAIVALGVETETGNIVGASARWIQRYP